MARKVFVSYKYKDEKVAVLKESYYEEVNTVMQWNTRKTRARDYVDRLQEKIGEDHINLGEKDGESLEKFADTTIESSLKRKISQSSITIVIISKGMKTNEDENEQWIPWEISYSLRKIPTGGNTKQMNAVLGVVLPDETGNYDWYYTSDQECNCTTNHTGQLFKILKKNMFNILKKEFRECGGTQIHITDEPSLIKTIKWETFMTGENFDFYIEKAIAIRDNALLYDVHINLKDL